MRRAIAIIISFLFLIPISFASTFDDVEVSDGNYVAIEYLVSIGTLEGYEDGTFQQEKTINRAELMKVLVAGQGIDPDEEVYQNCFPDVEEDWYAKYVCYAYKQEWVDGYPDGTFLPGQTVNKVEALKMLVNALDLDEMLPETVEEDLFDDIDNSAWYVPYVWVAKDLNLLEVTSGDYDPAGEMNRGGVAEYIFRTLVVQEMEVDVYSTTDRDGFLENHGLSELVESAEVMDETVDEVIDETVDETSESSDEIYEVDRVVDGDTIVLTNGEYVRLLGVDAPESDECFEEESTDYLVILLGDNSVTLEADPLNDDRDQYDRLLRYVYVEDTMINLQIIEDGYAEYYDSYDLSLDADFVAAELAASEAGLPIWEACYTVSSSNELYISYVFYDGEVAYVESDEYVKIINGGTDTINLKGYYIIGSKGDEKYTFPDVELEAEESITVYTDMGDYSFENGSAIWNNSGETVYLYDADDNLIDEYYY